MTERDEAWRAELERQLTEDVRERLYRAARARLRMFAGKARHVNDADVDDVVMSVLVDTLDGKLTWTPEQKPLERHLLDAIAYRVRDGARFRARHRQEEYEDEMHEVEAAIDADYDLRVVADQVVPEMRRRAAMDIDALVLLELYCEGITERADVIREAKMTPAQYDNAVRRLRRLTRQMPRQAREAALATLAERS